MYHLRRNKSELIVLTGAIYSFVAYLTAFSLEILFLIDLTRRGNEILATTTATTSPSLITENDQQQQQQATNTFDRFNFESMQAHITISCLTISILYFVIFITSLIVIVALILRSTFMLLIWMCAMATMYLPEFGLVIYVSVYSWGLDTRNGQTELVFYLIRAALNVIFIIRAHKLFKQWNHEKKFFRLKSGSNFSSTSNNHFGSPYDSPYFIGGGASSSLSAHCAGDSLSTTINPIFSSSTLNLNRYDFVRDQFDEQQQQQQQQASNSRNVSPITQNSHYNMSSTSGATSRSGESGRAQQNRIMSALYTRDVHNNLSNRLNQQRTSSYDFEQDLSTTRNPTNKKQYYLGDITSAPPSPLPLDYRQNVARLNNNGRQTHRLSQLSINDSYAEYEMDLDYRTLSKSPVMTDQRTRRESPQQTRYAHHKQSPYLHNKTPSTNTTGQRFQPHLDERQERRHVITRSHDDLAYSTQSLDRRNSRDFTLTEQVVLRPLGHQPFEYLHRPGSTTNLNYN